LKFVLWLKNILDKLQNLNDNFSVDDIDSISNVVNDLNNVDLTELKNYIFDITSIIFIFLDKKNFCLVSELF